jgi:hypothetical protein
LSLLLSRAVAMPITCFIRDQMREVRPFLQAPAGTPGIAAQFQGAAR